jgi:hypothetical protein
MPHLDVYRPLDPLIILHNILLALSACRISPALHIAIHSTSLSPSTEYFIFVGFHGAVVAASASVAGSGRVGISSGVGLFWTPATEAGEYFDVLV